MHVAAHRMRHYRDTYAAYAIRCTASNCQASKSSRSWSRADLAFEAAASATAKSISSTERQSQMRYAFDAPAVVTSTFCKNARSVTHDAAKSSKQLLCGN